MKAYKNVYYFPDYTKARRYALANGYPTDRIISYGRGWAIQLFRSGPYVGPATSDKVQGRFGSWERAL